MFDQWTLMSQKGWTFVARQKPKSKIRLPAEVDVVVDQAVEDRGIRKTFLDSFGTMRIRWGTGMKSPWHLTWNARHVLVDDDWIMMDLRFPAVRDPNLKDFLYSAFGQADVNVAPVR
jgi:hypothetical protein